MAALANTTLPAFQDVANIAANGVGYSGAGLLVSARAALEERRRCLKRMLQQLMGAQKGMSRAMQGH